LNIAVTFTAFGLLTQTNQVIAADNEPESNIKTLVDVLSKNKGQRVNDAFLNKRYEKALKLSDDPLIKGSAEYKLENYEDALQSFKQAQGADARYNEGNTLAKLEKYQEAIAAYDEALKINKEMKDALENKQMIQDFLKKQQQSDKQEQSSNENQQGNSDSQNAQQDQQNSSSQQSENEKNDSKDSQSAQKDDKQQDEKNQSNQFSDANEDAKKNQEEAEKEVLESAQKQTDDNEGEDSKENKDLAEQEQSEEPIDSDKQQQLNLAKKLAEELSKEEKMAAEQWLRRIPDDPGGLLRRKFRHQYLIRFCAC